MSAKNPPDFLYGTAWKEERTQACVEQALKAGFRGIDTANQRKHYFEVGVGLAVKAAIDQGWVRREDLFLQTKFTSIDGQDERLPYDPAAKPETQVRQSFESSLEHLHTDYLDSYVLHGPTISRGLAAEDWAIWRAMEALHDEGRAKRLGVSNVNLPQLELLCEKARVRPAFVQNRCYAMRGWDSEVRAFCKEQGIVYQGFSLLTANQAVLGTPRFRELVERAGCTPAQAVFRFAQLVGMLPLTGTTDPAHMKEDLDCSKITLSAQDLLTIETLASG
jgi:diketogulonate reductase-like aldo/keto reductase